MSGITVQPGPITRVRDMERFGCADELYVRYEADRTLSVVTSPRGGNDARCRDRSVPKAPRLPWQSRGPRNFPRGCERYVGDQAMENDPCTAARRHS
jgi:hypothetical protein